MEVIDARPGFLCFKAIGRAAPRWFADEAGGHRWQRVPPTEKRGRVHSSTVTVVVLEPASAVAVEIRPEDLEEEFCRGSGKGGQHRNKTSTAVHLRHKPSGHHVRVDGGRSQSINRETALELLRARLSAEQREAARADRCAARKAQAGSGMRGDKVRTIQVQGDVVVDHRRGTRMTYRRFARGHLEDLDPNASSRGE
nr:MULTISPECIES: peptide chain release factor-like protein [unclassified Nannocystis]